MNAGPLLLLTSQLLSQTPRSHASAPEPSALPRVEASPGAPAMMSWERDVQCTELAPSRAVPSGRYRIQCDERTKTCLASATHPLDRDGVETREPLARESSCTPDPFLGEKLGREGFRFVQGTADAPPGFLRDESGRVLQATFNLNARIYVGLAAAPIWTRFDGAQPARLRAEFGIQSEFRGDDASTALLHRLRFLEGAFDVGDAQRVEGVIFHYDNSAERTSPIRLTTLVGQPHRNDLTLNLGLYVDVVRWESLKRGGASESFLTWASFQGLVDLWHSHDLSSYFRLRLGVGVESDTKRDFVTAKPEAALEGDLTLDARGIHHLRFGAQGEKLLFAPEVLGRPLNPERLRVHAAYEVVVFAINDRPFTLLFEGRGTWRDDLPSVPPSWEWAAQAGLRINFWVDARPEPDASR